MSEHPAVAFLEAELGRVKELARALPPGPWRWVEVDGEGGEYEALWGVDGKAVLASSDTEGYKSWIYRHDGFDAYLPLVDPAAVLRRVKADRALLADLLAERHEVVDGDCWYTCVAATEDRDGGECCDDERRGGPCDCGRDVRVERRVRLLAEGYGWVAP